MVVNCSTVPNAAAGGFAAPSIRDIMRDEIAKFYAETGYDCDGISAAAEAAEMSDPHPATVNQDRSPDPAASHKQNQNSESPKPHQPSSTSTSMKQPNPANHSSARLAASATAASVTATPAFEISNAMEIKPTSRKAKADPTEKADSSPTEPSPIKPAPSESLARRGGRTSALGTSLMNGTRGSHAYHTLERIGGWRVEREIADGPFARVTLARDDATGKKVAIKSLKRDETGHYDDDAFREIRVLTLLRHPNIVTVNDVFAARGGIHVVMPYHDRGDLTLFVAREQPNQRWSCLSEQKAVLIWRQLLADVCYLHEVWRFSVKCPFRRAREE
ncbi:CBL-interacting serine/threonine-protein kinase 9 [Borealophlyctis nickersoniae]|nr:CBL-interacting serine/threonine-protein kinase 9 [Borealophlyctis nickersoniae]